MKHMTRGESSGNTEADRKRRPKLFGALYLLMSLAAMAVVLLVASPARNVEQLPYSDFKHMVRAGRIAEVVVDERQIRGIIKEADRRFETTRIDDPGLLDDLERQGVKVTGGTESHGWADLAGWIVPLLILVLLWPVMLRRPGPGQGAIAFGHSRAKIYAEDDVKVTFADVAGIDEATEELREVVDFLQNPKKYTDLGARIPKGVLLPGRQGPARRCWPAPWPAKPTTRFSASAVLSSSRCSSASAPHASAICSRRPNPVRPASCSSTSWMRSARHGINRRSALTRSASRR